MIIGCGDIGRRIAQQLINDEVNPESILGIVKSTQSADLCADIGIKSKQVDFDDLQYPAEELANTNCYYLVPPPKAGVQDLRTQALLCHLTNHEIKLN